MFSKKIGSALIKTISLLLIFATQSCGLKFSENENKQEPVQMGTGECLKKTGRDISAFLKGTAVSAQVQASAACVSDTLREFSNSVSGENKEYYTIDEIKYFIDKNVFKDNEEISRDLVKQLFLFKASIVGGENEKIRKTEFKSLANIFDAIAPDLVDINPQMYIISGKWDPKELSFEAKRQEFLVAARKLNSITETLFSRFPQGNDQYTINALVDLIKSVMIQIELPMSTVNDIESYRGLAKQIKSRLVSPGEKITTKDWPKIGYALSKVLEIKLIGTYFKGDDATDSNARLKYMGLLLQDIFDAIENAMMKSQVKFLTPDDVYSLSQEIFKVVDPTVKVDQSFVKALTIFKNILSDGRAMKIGDNWTVADMKQIADKADVILNRASVVMSSFNEMSDKKNITYAQFEALEKRIQQAITEFLPTISGEFNIADLKLLLEQVQKSGLIKDIDLLKDFDRNYAVLNAAQSIFSSSSDSLLETSELRNILQVGSRVYSHFLEYDRFMKDYSSESNTYAYAGTRLVDKALVTISGALQYNRNHYFGSDYLAQGYQWLIQKGVIKNKLSVDNFKIIITTLRNNILITPENRLAGKKLPGLDMEAFNTLGNLANKYFYGTTVANEVIAANAKYTQSQLMARLSLLIQNNSQDTKKQASLKDFYNAHVTAGSMTFNSYNGMEISTARNNIYKVSDLHQSNLARQVSSLLIRSFSKSLTAVQKLSGLTESELQSAFDGLKPVLYQLDLVSKESINFIKSRFREANLFVSHGNGDGLIQYYELHDITLHLISGSERANYMLKPLLKTCAPKFVDTYNRYTLVPEACVINFLYKNNTGFEQLPQYIAYRSSVKPEEATEYYLNLLLAVGYERTDSRMVQVQNILDYPHLVQYIEMMFTKYDKNSSGSLNKDEALAAFPVFRQTIKDAVEKMDANIKEKELPGVFIYFLKNGKPPETLWQKLQFKLFIGNEKKWEIEATRANVGLAFSFLAN